LLKKIVISILVVLVLFTVFNFFGPYNIFLNLNAENILEEPSLIEEFNGVKVIDVSYIGDDTYIVKTEDKDFIVRRDYFSVMNYKWKIFEYKKQLEP
jgi:hypothetical protein